MDKQIREFLDSLPEKKRKLVTEVRRIVLAADPSVTESIKWGNLTFVANGKNIAFIYSYNKKDYINFGFFKATELSDPKKLFEGTGQGMRHVKIRDKKQIDQNQFAKWVREAVRMNTKSKSKRA